MDDELDLSEALRDAAGEPEDSESGTDEDMVIAEDADQMATKLDLARAYLDMGDNDGARVILEQVIAAGSGEQQQEARELLSRVD
jgi:pilus assembly protein FimV